MLAQSHHEEHNRTAALRRRALIENAPVLMRVQIRIHRIGHGAIERQPEDVRIVAGRQPELAEADVQHAALVEAERAERNVATVVILKWWWETRTNCE